MKYLIWDEPYTMNPLTHVECKMSYDDVLKAQKATYKEKANSLTDEQIFDSFVVVHWGRVIEEEEENECNSNAME